MRIAAALLILALTAGCERRLTPIQPATPPAPPMPTPTPLPAPSPAPEPEPAPEPAPLKGFARLEFEATRIPIYPGVKAEPPFPNEMNGVVFMNHELVDTWEKIEGFYDHAFKDLGWIRRPGEEDRWTHRDGGMELYLQLNGGKVVISLNLE